MTSRKYDNAGCLGGFLGGAIGLGLCLCLNHDVTLGMYWKLFDPRFLFLCCVLWTTIGGAIGAGIGAILSTRERRSEAVPNDHAVTESTEETTAKKLQRAKERSAELRQEENDTETELRRLKKQIAELEKEEKARELPDKAAGDPD